MASWLIYALLSAVFAALVAIFGKVGLQNIDANTATTIRAIVMALFLIGVIAFQGKLTYISDVITNKKALMFILLSGISGALSWLFYFIAIQHGKVSQVAPIDKLSVVFAVILAMLLLSEKISFLALLGIMMISVGTLLVALN